MKKYKIEAIITCDGWQRLFILNMNMADIDNYWQTEKQARGYFIGLLGGLTAAEGDKLKLNKISLCILTDGDEITMPDWYNQRSGKLLFSEEQSQVTEESMVEYFKPKA